MIYHSDVHKNKRTLSKHEVILWLFLGRVFWITFDSGPSHPCSHGPQGVTIWPAGALLTQRSQRASSSLHLIQTILWVWMLVFSGSYLKLSAGFQAGIHSFFKWSWRGLLTEMLWARSLNIPPPEMAAMLAHVPAPQRHRELSVKINYSSPPIVLHPFHICLNVKMCAFKSMKYACLSSYKGIVATHLILPSVLLFCW